MMVLITYDVNLETPSGSNRLRRVAKVCENVGQRVQKSVFECIVQPDQFVLLKSKLLSIIDKEKDSLRFYLLGANWVRRIEHYGVAPRYTQDGPIIL
ncbi:MAG TPA: CRISPR-associated endonuclease Cas2 [Candidatus Atribacteria bacterium]|nr:CRISPR-associated endonuclease Cas2 [Candidatus Atribacteria bacterium]